MSIVPAGYVLRSPGSHSAPRHGRDEFKYLGLAAPVAVDRGTLAESACPSAMRTAEINSLICTVWSPLQLPMQTSVCADTEALMVAQQGDGEQRDPE